MKFRNSFWGTAGGVDVVTTEVGTEFKGVFDRNVGEVLVAESYYFALGNEQSELITACGRELAELDATNFGANVGR